MSKTQSQFHAYILVNRVIRIDSLWLYFLLRIYRILTNQAMNIKIYLNVVFVHKTNIKKQQWTYIAICKQIYNEIVGLI